MSVGRQAKGRFAPTMKFKALKGVSGVSESYCVGLKPTELILQKLAAGFSVGKKTLLTRLI